MRLTVSIALLLALAGCFGGGKGGGAADVPEPAAPTATTGVLTGLVIDDAVRPLVANVTLLPVNRTVPAADGLFQFDALQPGSYLLVARAAGYATVQATAAVVAGQTTESRIVLAKLPDTTPYPVTYPFDGYVQASTGLLGAATSSDPTGSTSCTCTFEAQAEPGVSRLVLEASWDDWMADPTGPTEFLWRIDAIGANASVQGSGTSPIHKVLGSLDFPADGFLLANATGFQVTIWPDAVWPAVSQQYSAYLTLWYRGPPPEGWSLIQET